MISKEAQSPDSGKRRGVQMKQLVIAKTGPRFFLWTRIGARPARHFPQSPG
jgi:hypothetical protein